jgi:alpha-N-arabinofuranosidase
MNAHNTFENPDKVTIQDFDNAEVQEDRIEINIPAKSVVMAEFK